MNKIRKELRRFDAAASGFSLIETVLALAVVAVTFIGLIGLLGLGVATDQTSTEQTVATSIAGSIVADLRSIPNLSPLPSSTRYGVSLPATVSALSTVTTPTKTLYFDNAQNSSTTLASTSAYKASIYVANASSIGTANAQKTYVVRVLVSWPAQTTTIPVGNVDIITQFRIN